MQQEKLKERKDNKRGEGQPGSNGAVRKQGPAGRRQGSGSEALPRYPGATWRQASVTLGARMALVLR